MKKIGLLTYHWVANFGANLQTYSTLNYIRKNGYEPVVINWIPSDTETRYCKITSPLQIKVHNDFHQKYGNISRICRTSSDVVDVIKEMQIDEVIIGSDAVLTYIPKFDRIIISKRKGILYKSKVETDSDFPIPYWGDFLNSVNVPTALMSASAQNTKYYHIVFGKKKFAHLLNKIEYISVRDIWTQKMLSHLTGGHIQAHITPDPVFAFNYNIPTDEIISFETIRKKYQLPEKYALLSLFNPFFDDQWVKDLHSLFKDKGVELIGLPKANTIGYSMPLDRRMSMPIPPLDWYYIIKYSQAYIGELMHPVIVSLHNSVPVYSIDTYGWKRPRFIGRFDPETSKIVDILTRFGFEKNIYNVKAKCPKPTAKEIFGQIMSFDKNKCTQFAAEYYRKYTNMMNAIVNL